MRNAPPRARGFSDIPQRHDGHRETLLWTGIQSHPITCGAQEAYRQTGPWNNTAPPGDPAMSRSLAPFILSLLPADSKTREAPDSPRVWRQNSPLPSADRFSGGPPAAPPQTNPIRPLPPGSSPGECRATRHSHAASRRSDAVESRSDIASHRSFNARCRTETVSTRSATVIDKTAHVSTRSDIATDKIKTSPGRAGQRMYSPLLALRPATPIPIRLPGGQPLGGCLPGLPEQFAGLSPLHSDSGSLRLKAQ